MKTGVIQDLTIINKSELRKKEISRSYWGPILPKDTVFPRDPHDIYYQYRRTSNHDSSGGVS